MLSEYERIVAELFQDWHLKSNAERELCHEALRLLRIEYGKTHLPNPKLDGGRS